MKTCKKGLHQYDSSIRRCPECVKIRGSSWYKSNSDKKNARSIAWAKSNPDKVKVSHSTWKKSNPEKVKMSDGTWKKSNPNYQADWYMANLDKVKTKSANWAKVNRNRKNAAHAKRRAAQLHSTPIWITDVQLENIQEFYTLAKELQWLSEEPLEVDHIIPLQGKNVCGLHVPWNLQILTVRENRIKNNKL